MGRRALNFGLAALATAGLVSGQTWSLCNPIKGEKCPPNPAFSAAKSSDFSKAKGLKDLEAFWTVDPGVKYDARQVEFDAQGLKMTIYEEDDAPTLTSKDYLFFGKVDVTMRAAPGQGIVSSIVLQSDCLDEIDWEFVGGDQARVQTNYYAKGVNDYTHARYFETGFNPMTSLHTYTFEWTPSALTFAVDGKVLRTATPDEGSYPSTPMQLKIGTWVGGKGTSQGTIDWAGGLAQWEQAPFPAWYKEVRVTDYAGGYRGAKEYVYTDTTGAWESIQVVGGSKVGVPALGNWQAIGDAHHEEDHSSTVVSSTKTSSTVRPTTTSTTSTTSSTSTAASTTTSAQQSSTPTPSPTTTVPPNAAGSLRSGSLAVVGSALVGVALALL